MRRLALLALLAAGTAHAQPAPHTAHHAAHHADATAVTFAEALRAAAATPDLAAAQRAGHAWRAGIAGGGAPTVRAQLAPGFGDDGGAWQLELAAALTPGRAAAARRAARAEVAALDATTAVTRRERLAHAAAAWLAAWAARAQLTLADEELARAVELVELAERGRALGVSTRVDQAAAAAYRVELEARHLELEGRVSDAELTLAAATGGDPGRPLTAAGDLPAVAVDGPLVSVATAARRAEAEAARQHAGAARAAQRRQLELGVRGELDAGTRTGFVLLGVTLPGGDRGALDAAMARARAAVLEGEAELSARSDGTAQARARHDVEHTHGLVAVRTRRVAALTEQTAALEAARDAGEALLPELVQARRALIAGRAELLEARALAAGALVDRALLAGWEGP